MSRQGVITAVKAELTRLGQSLQKTVTTTRAEKRGGAEPLKLSDQFVLALPSPCPGNQKACFSACSVSVTG